MTERRSTPIAPRDVHSTRADARRARRSTIRRYRGALIVGAVAAVAALTATSIVQNPAPASAATFGLGETVASDSFARTQSSGFGSADTGGAYDQAKTAGLSVASGVGRFSLTPSGGARNAILRSASTTDSRTGVTFTVPKNPVGGSGLYTTLQSRSNGGAYYGATLTVAPGGNASLRIVRVDGEVSNKKVLADSISVGKNLAAGTPIRVELEVAGSSTVTVKARAYVAGKTAPDWQRTATDSSSKRILKGSAGLWAYQSSGSKAVTVLVDDLTAVRLVPSTNPPAPAPTPTPTTPPVTTPPAPAPTTPAPTPTQPPEQPSTSSTRGSAAVGTTSYPVPSGAVYVSASAASEGNGSKSSPYKTVARAIEKAPNGATLVLRGGTYHEYVELRGGKRLTIQSYPGEAVWFDGSEKISSWKKTGSTWFVDGWDYDFDTSPTFTQGAPDNTDESTKFLDPAYPLAAHPDQVWIDGKPLTEVGSRGAVKDGTFYVDRRSNQLFLGTNPAGRDVRASTLQKAIDVMTAGSTIRGIGVQRYATSVWQKAPLLAQASNVTFENVVSRDNAASGVSAANGKGIVFRNITISGNGRSGGGATYSDAFTLSGSLVEGNNSQHFKGSPSSGGFKIGRSRDVTFTDNDFLSNLTTGLWFDESVYDGTVTGNRISDNGTGLTLELSAKVVVADNVIDANETYGLHIQNSGDVQVWNNTIVHNERGTINIVQDQRRQTDLRDAGHDPRQKLPDMTIPWLTQDITISNNVLGSDTTSGMLHVIDQEKKLTAEKMRVTLNGNLYQNATKGGYTFIRWADGGSGLSYYRSLSEFQADTGQDKRSALLTAPTAVNGDFALTSEARNAAKGIAVSVPGFLSGLLAGLGLPTLGASPTP